MNIQVLKVGIVSCSGEGIPCGTISRIACRKVLDELKPSETVTICLPLFISGGKEEREFAKTFPTITLDGCDKCCAKISTERFSAKPAQSMVVSEILKKHGLETPTSLRNLTPAEKTASDIVADEVARAVEDVLAR